MSEYLKKDDVMQVIAKCHDRLAGLPYGEEMNAERISVTTHLSRAIEKLRPIELEDPKMPILVKEIAPGNAFKSQGYEYLRITATEPVGWKACLKIPECESCFLQENMPVELLSIYWEVRPLGKENSEDE